MVNYCKSCQEVSLERIDNNGEDELVCTSCGMVQERGSFSSEVSSHIFVGNRNPLFPHQAMPIAIRNQSIAFKPEGLKHGNRKIALFVSTFRLSQDMAHQVYTLYGRAFADKHMMLWSLNKKTILASCCLYVVMRQHDWPVTISNICNAVGCTRGEFSQPFHKLVAFCNLSIKMPPVEDLMEGFIKECKGLEETERTVILDRSLSVIGIAKDCWLTCGRMPRPLLLAAVYLSWQSLKPRRSRVSMDKFCSQMGLAIQKHANLRKKELFVALCKISVFLPWHREDEVTPKNLSFHLEDILKYSETLLQECNPDEKTFKLHPEKKSLRTKFSDEGRALAAIEDAIPPTDVSSHIWEEEIDSYIRSKEEVDFIMKMNATFLPST